jgi:hypothetical protein
MAYRANGAFHQELILPQGKIYYFLLDDFDWNLYPVTH